MGWYLFDLGKKMNVGQVDLRNAYAKNWAHGTKEFDISMGYSASGPWTSILNGTLTAKVWPAGIHTNTSLPAPPREEFPLKNPAGGRYLKFMCLSTWESLKNYNGVEDRCSLNYLGVFEAKTATPWV